MKRRRIIAWILMACQMIAWAWFQTRGGQVTDTQYLVFCGALMLGQTGSAIECISTKAWGTLIVQVYFFAFTAFGAIMRLRHG